MNKITEEDYSKREYTFQFVDSDGDSLKLVGYLRQDCTHPEVTDLYLQFLRGCGYHVGEREDL